MATTLTYGRVRPAQNDRQSVWTDALEDNIDLDDAHDHDGTDSAFLPPNSISKPTSSIAAVDWAGSAGVYTKTVTIPTTISNAATYNDIKFFHLVINDASGNRCFPTILRVTSSTYTVTVSDNTLDLTIYYI